MKRVSLAPVCLQVCNTFFFLLQNPSGELSKQVSICLSFASNSWVHFRAQGTTGLVTGTWVWAEVMTDREALTFQQPPPWDVQEITSSSYPMTSSLAGIPHATPDKKFSVSLRGSVPTPVFFCFFFSFVATSHGKNYFSAWVLEWEKTESRGLHKLLGARMGGGNKHWVVPTSTDRGCLGRQPGLLTEVPDVDHSPPWPDTDSTVCPETTQVQPLESEKPADRCLRFWLCVLSLESICKPTMKVQFQNVCRNHTPVAKTSSPKNRLPRWR